MKCRLCGGLLCLLGQLGLLAWFRCRDCGMQFSKTRKPRCRKK
jgi:hypothetical protein